MSSGPPAVKPSRSAAPRILAAAALVVGAVWALAYAMRAAPDFTLDAHWIAFGRRAIVAGILLAIAAALLPRPFRPALAIAGVFAVAIVACLHPVCVPIPDGDIPAFETVMSLEQRAARGEPFRNFSGHWYQCKSFLARSFFF